MSDRTPNQIEEDLLKTRREFEQTIDELTSQLDPKVQLEQLKIKATEVSHQVQKTTEETVVNTKKYVQELIEKASEGDTQAVKTLVGVAAGIIGTVGLIFALKRR